MVLKTLIELENELNRRCFHPVYLILGSETYQVKQALRLLKQKVLAPEALALDYAEFSARQVPVSEILSVASMFPMMSPHRLVFVNDVGSLPANEQDNLLAYLDRPALKCVLVLEATELDRRTTFCRVLKEKTCVVEFPKLKGGEMEGWAGRFVRSQGYEISSAALKKLVEIAGSDLQALAGEIEKLMIYSGEVKSISDSAIEDLVRRSRVHGIFELTGALGKRDRRAALAHLGNLLESGEPPLMIVTMMGRQFRQMLIAKELLRQGRNEREAASAAQVPGFVASEFISQVRSIDLEVIKKLYLQLAGIDYRFKSSGADEKMVLESLICSI